MNKKKGTFSGLIFGIGLLTAACGAAKTPDAITETGKPEVVTESNLETTNASTAVETSNQEEETVEYEGEFYLKSELSENTLNWLEYYNTMPEEEQRKINMVPHDLIRNTDGITMETDVAAGDLLLTGAPEIRLTDSLSSKLEEFKLTSGNYEWGTMEKGKVVEMAACGAHPLDTTMKENDRLKVPNYNRMEEVPYSLSCVIPPDQLTVTMWDASSLGDTEAKPESVTTCEWNSFVNLKPGKVYELTAQWSRDQLDRRGFFGTASYAFITE